MFLLGTHVDTVVHTHDAHIEVKQPQVLSDLLDTGSHMGPDLHHKTRPRGQQISRYAPSLLPTLPLLRLTTGMHNASFSVVLDPNSDPQVCKGSVELTAILPASFWGWSPVPLLAFPIHSKECSLPILLLRWGLSKPMWPSSHEPDPLKS